MTTLASTLEEVRRRIRRNGSRPMNEENTKATLIEPVLRALGWAVEDVEEVQREFKTNPRHKPVDYGLLVLRTPRLLIEAKALQENLNDHRWLNQIMGYASVAGVEWIVLTNGDEYRIYNTHAPVVVEEKLFRAVKLAGDDPAALQTLELLAKNRLEENRIEVLWRAHFVDRQVKAAIEHLFSPDSNDMLLVNHVLGATKNLSAEEVRSSIARCRVTLDFPVDMAALEKSAAKPAGRKARAVSEKAEAATEVTLDQILAAGLLKAPATLTKEYKGRALTATVLPDGRVRVSGKDYDSLSTAASVARAQVIGEEKPTNGWTFWQVTLSDGGTAPIDVLRTKVRRRGRAIG